MPTTFALCKLQTFAIGPARFWSGRYGDAGETHGLRAAGDGGTKSMGAWFERDRIPPGKTVAQARSLLERTVVALGLQRFSYIALRLPPGCRMNVYSTVITNYPREWVERYFERNYALLDPYLLRASRETRPFLWSTDLCPRDARQRRFLAESRDFGISNGLAIPVRCADGALGIFNVAGPDAERVREAARHGGGELLAAACDAHEFAVGRVAGTQAGGVDGPALSARQRECLRWTLEGKTAKETAAILGLSVFTVNRHALNATRKLAALNKHHAAIQAFRAGLI